MSPLFDVKPAIEALDALLAYQYPAVDFSPIARTSNSVLRPSRADAVRAILRDIDETRASVTALEQKIEKLVFGLRKQRATVAATLGPVSGLPTELLVEVFRTVVEYDRTSKARITLSHVSSPWRTVALGTKDLWTVIQVPSHAPEMVHEFARRSGNLRLELSTRSLASWPEDLALTSDEASRLSVLFSHSSPPLTFSASLTKYASLMSLDRLIIAAGGAAHDVHSAMCQVRNLKLDGTKLSGWITMGLLESLTICNSSAGIATEHVTRIMAPRMSQLELSGIRGKNLGDENDNASVADPHWSDLHFEIWGYQDQITAFTLSRSDRSVFLRVLNLWKLPNLVSLTLRFTDLDGSSHEMDTWYLYALLSGSPAIKHFYLAFPRPTFRFIFGESHAPFLLPNLETLSVSCTDKTNVLNGVERNKSNKEELLDALRMRSNRPDIRRLHHLTLSSAFVIDEAEEQQAYGAYIDKVTIDHS